MSTSSNHHADLLADYTIVDCDVHVSYGHPDVQRLVARYMDEPYRSYLDPDGPSYSSPYPTDGRPRTLGGKLPRETVPAVDAETIHEHLCEEHGVDYAVLSVPPVLNRIQDVDRVLAEMRAMNDVLVDHFLDEEDAFYGLATVYAKHPEAAAEEVRRVADEKDVVGLLVQSSGVETPLGDPTYDVLYQAAEEHDLPVVFHGTADVAHAMDMPIVPYGLRSYTEAHALGHQWAQMLTVTSLAIQGVPVKFPDLRFAFLESGTAWVRWMLARVNREYGQRRSEAPLLERSPEEHVGEASYFGTHPLEPFADPEDGEKLLGTVGADSLVYASNFPRADFDGPGDLLDGIRGFDEDERRQVFSGNAAELFGLRL